MVLLTSKEMESNSGLRQEMPLLPINNNVATMATAVISIDSTWNHVHRTIKARLNHVEYHSALAKQRNGVKLRAQAGDATFDNQQQRRHHGDGCDIHRFHMESRP